MIFNKQFSKIVKKLFFVRYYSVNMKPKSNLWKPDNTVISPYKKINVPNISLSDFIWQNIARWENKTAVVCAVTNRLYTYNQLYKYSRNFAANLRKKIKIRDDEVICIIMPNIIEYPIATLGALQAGAVVSVINPSSTIRKLAHTFLCANPKAIITTSEYIYSIKETMSSLRKTIPIIALRNCENSLPEGVISLRDVFEDSQVDLGVLYDVKRSAEDVALLPFSSGTTGMPKQVELLNRNLIASCLTQEIDEIKVCLDTTSTHQDTLLVFLPLYHMYGMVMLMLHKLAVGAKLVMMPRMQPDLFVSAVKEHKVDVLFIVPPTAMFLGSHPLVTKERMESVRHLVWSAAPMAPEDLTNCLDRFRVDLKVTQIYGSTEALAVSGMLPGGHNSGYALSNIQMKIIGLENGHKLGPNEVGELLVKGPQVMKGYRNNPEATKNAFDKDHWFKTGDLALINNDGALKILGGIEELIEVNGFQVSPNELENILREHPCVLDAAVIGIPDSKMGEVPKAFVIIKDTITEKDLVEFVNGKVRDYKRLKNVVILNTFPKSSTGKILRKLLKEYR